MPTLNGRPFIGEGWTDATSYEWFVVVLVVMWERDADPEWRDFAADWARDLYRNGAE